jgi:hypothetical protein
MDSKKVPLAVTPAHAGVYYLLIRLDPGFRQDDVKRLSLCRFYRSAKKGYKTMIAWKQQKSGL